MSDSPPSLANWPWNPALLPYQRDLILAWERGTPILSTGFRGGKRLMAEEARKRWAARQREKGQLKGLRADVIFIDEVMPLEQIPEPVVQSKSSP